MDGGAANEVEAQPMMGWLALLLLIAASLAGLRALGLKGAPLTAAAAALCLGASGYALQGRPDVSAAPAAGGGEQLAIPLTSARQAFFGQFTPAESWLKMSEALGRTGNRADAAGILENAVRRYPGDAQLWVGLGNALVDQAGGLTPPAEYAFRRASEAAPGNPAGMFFYGVALARSGDPADAVALWKSILADAPPKASWRPLIESGIAALSAPPPHAGS
jgi:cytochrome c-type biogenesis protein CcmH